MCVSLTSHGLQRRRNRRAATRPLSAEGRAGRCGRDLRIYRGAGGGRRGDRVLASHVGDAHLPGA